MSRPKASLLPAPLLRIESRILVIGEQKVMIDSDLAELYGVTTKRLNEQVKRNVERFPRDFMFTLTRKQKEEVVAKCDHLTRLKYSRSLPFVFTEHGAIQAANVLASREAVEMGVHVVRAFVHLREAFGTDKSFVQRLGDLERSATAQASRHRKLAASTQAQLAEVFNALRMLTAPPPLPPASPKRPIGFIELEEKPARTRARKAR